jgi:hypothetical protein
MTDKEADNKKYNDIMKNEKAHEEQRIAWIVFGIISGIIIVIILYKYKLKPVYKTFTGMITSFFKFIPQLLINYFSNRFSTAHRLTTLMVINFIGVVGGLFYVVANMVNNPYDPSNTPLLWIFGILSVLLSIFFRMRFWTHKDKFVNTDGIPFMQQLKNIWGIMKQNYKTTGIISVVILTIVMFAFFISSSDKVFVTTGSFLLTICLIGAMFALYSIVIKSEHYKWIKNLPSLHFIFNLIFLIPCVIVFAVNWVSEQIKNTPSFVFFVLLIQIAIITLYFLIPFTERHLYFSLSNKKTNSEDLKKIMERNRQEKEYLIKKVFRLKQALFKKSTKDNYKYMNEQGVNDEWDRLFKFYSDNESNESNEPVSNHLKSIGLCTTKEDCDNCIEGIKSKQKEIIELEEKINTIKTELSPEEKINDSELAGEDETYDIKDIKDAIVLKMPPVSLKTKTALTSPENINLFENIANQPNYSYSLSFWIFMHAQLGSISECNNVINFDSRPHISYCPVYKKIPLNAVVKYKDEFAKVTKVKKIKNTYIYDLSSVSMNSENKFRSYHDVSGSKVTYDYPYSVLKFNLGSEKSVTKQEFIMPNIKMQKWNNIVVNFMDGTYDLFVNGKLVNSFQGVMEEFKYNNIIIGDDNGVSGGIANIVYYKNYLTKDKILRNYNFLKKRSPPIVSNLVKTW